MNDKHRSLNSDLQQFYDLSYCLFEYELIY